MVKNMVEYKAYGGRALSIAIGTLLVFLVLLGSSASVVSAEVIVDEQSSGFTKYGTPSFWKEASIGYNNHMFYTYNGQSSVDNYAMWKPSLSSEGAGTYTVYVYIPGNYADTTNAVYTIYHNGITDTRYVNQASYFNVWVTLGDFYFSASGNDYIKLVDATGESSATKRVGFDAVKWIKKESILARIDSYSPNSKITVTKGTPFTINVQFTNTGNTGANFYGGASIWDSNGIQIYDGWSGVTYLGAGQQGIASMSPTINTPGEYYLQFGVWDGTKSILFDKKPSPYQNLLKVVEPTTNTGTLSVTTTPVNGNILVDGVYKGTGSWSGSVNTGSYTVSFGAFSGYTTPSQQTVNVNTGQTTIVTGTYVPIQTTGTLSVTTTPVNSNILVDGVSKGTGSWSGSVNTGSYTVSFGAYSGYTTPSQQTVNVNTGQTTTVTGTYVLVPSPIDTNWGFSYENDYNSIINEEISEVWGSTQPSLPPLIIKAMIATESGFNKDAVSVSGFCGLMQTPCTANYGVHAGTWQDPRTAIHIGLTMLKEKMVNMQNPTFLSGNHLGITLTVPSTLPELWKYVIDAYNAGQGTMRESMAYAKQDGKDTNIWQNIVEPQSNPSTSPLWKAVIYIGFSTSKYTEIKNYIIGPNGVQHWLGLSGTSIEKLTAPPSALRIGIEAGHYPNAGAYSCDGQTNEKDINWAVANKAAEILRQRGYTVDVKPAGSGISGYVADAFVALHADYCAGTNTGFKVSRYGGTKGTGKTGNDDASDRLVDSLWNAYGAATGLPRDTSVGHFTDNMIYYYALNPSGGIATSTPGAIIEMGWLSGDLAFLRSIDGQQRMANGIADAMDQFLGHRLKEKSLLRVDVQNEVYWFQNNKLYWITDWDVINNMSGVPGWGSVNVLPVSVFNPASIPWGPRFINTEAISDGLLIQGLGSPETYRISGGEKHHIISPEVFVWKGYNWADVIEVSSQIIQMFPSGSDITFTGTLSATTIPVNGNILVDGVSKGTGSWSGPVNTGSHTVSFGAVSGYTTPSQQTVNVNTGQTTAVTGTYVLTPGTLSVTTTPVNGNILVDGVSKGTGSWSRPVNTGSHTVSFGAVSGYTTPSQQTVNVNTGQTTAVTGTYALTPGTLSVTTTPVNGNILVDGVSKGTGSWSGPVNTGSHTVSFGAVSGYTTPSQQTVNVNTGQTTAVTGTYVLTPGTLSVTTTPVNGNILVDGVSKGTGSWSGPVNTGSHTVSFGAVSGYTTPSQQTVTVNTGQTTAVTGTYVIETASVIGNTPIGINVPTGSRITITFSKAMNSDSVETAFSTIPATTGSFSWSGNTMTYTPASLNYSTAYNVRMGTGARDMAGNNLPSSFEWQFTTGAKTSINLLTNPGFESGAALWSKSTNGIMTFAAVTPGYEGSYAARLGISSTGTNMQIYQKITLEPNTRYRLSFVAYSTTGHDMVARLILGVSPYSTIGSAYTANLNNNWQTFTTEIDSGSVTNARLQFFFAGTGLAAPGDVYYIDNVILEKI